MKPLSFSLAAATALFLASCAENTHHETVHNNTTVVDTGATTTSTTATSATTTTTAMPSADTNYTGQLAFLKDWNGKYPRDVNMLDDARLKPRLQKLLGNAEYDFLKSIWQTQAPIEVNNGLFYAWAMKAHEGGDPGAVVMADLRKDVLYVGIRKNKQEKTYSEDGSPIPQRMQQWADEQ